MPKLKLHIKLALLFFILSLFFGIYSEVASYNADITFFGKLNGVRTALNLFGWMYIALTTLLTFHCIRKAKALRLYRYIFLSSFLSILAFSLTILISGVSLISLFFFYCFTLTTYWYVYFFLKNHDKSFKDSASNPFILSALFFLIFSSSVLWLILFDFVVDWSPAILQVFENFFIHFHMNGWITLALLGIYILLAEKNKVEFHQVKLHQSLYLLITGILISFFLSMIINSNHLVFNYIGMIGAVLQFVGFWILLSQIERKTNLKQRIQPKQRAVLSIFTLLLFIKLYLQLISSIPYFTQLVREYSTFYYGYINLFTLGVASIGLLQLLQGSNLIKLSTDFIWFYFSCFVVLEIIVFFGGVHSLSPSFDYIYLIINSLTYLLMFIGLGWVLVKNLKSSNYISILDS